jgi:glycosyltransferase involved in cell wall biosynthesis
MGYDIDEWDVKRNHGEYLLYFGRIVECKGLYTVKEIAKHVDMPVIMCGAGDPTPFLDESIPNLSYRPPVTGKDRSDLLGNAYAMLMPTAYTEPFGGAGVEGMLCGTPLLASDFGAFSETVEHGFNGFRCKTLGDWLHAFSEVGRLHRVSIAEDAREKYSLENVGAQMDRIFRQIQLLDDKGWYSLEQTDAIWR